MNQEFDIDNQILKIQETIAEYTQKLFQAQGQLMLALHLKEKCDIKAKEKPVAPSSPA